MMSISNSIIILFSLLFCLMLVNGMPARNRQRGGGDSRCKYRKGQMGDCNTTTLKRTRTDTLMENSPASCNATRIFEKPCKRKTCEFGPWTEYGQCESGRQVKTRPILTGTPDECGKKARKTKPCRNGGGGRNTGQRGGGGRRGGGQGHRGSATGDQAE